MMDSNLINGGHLLGFISATEFTGVMQGLFLFASAVSILAGVYKKLKK